MFLGRHDHTVDSKGRLSIPAGHRVEIQRRSEKAPILTTHQDHLRLYPFDEWEQIAEKLLSKSSLQPDVEAYQRFVASGAAECPIDSQGRILIPPPLRKHAELGTKVTVAGVLNKIEIWNTERYEQEHQKVLARWSEIQRSVDQDSRVEKA